MGTAFTESAVLQIFERISKDEQDGVRVLAAEVSIVLFSNQENAGVTQFVMPFLQTLCADTSWRVRYIFASRICELCGYNPEEAVNTFLPYFVQFLRDTDVEVRTAASQSLAEVARLVPTEEILNTVIPELELLTRDQTSIRTALATNLCDLALIVGPEISNAHLLPQILALLRDEESSIRLCIFDNLDKL